MTTTTYGTIPTTSSSSTPSNNLEFISTAKSRIRSNLSTRRPWLQLIPLSLQSFSLPPSPISGTLLRIRTNLTHFRTNYAIIMLTILFLSLLYHPVSLIVFLLTMAAWLFLYFLRDTPILLFGREVDDRLVMFTLSIVTLMVLFFTRVTVNIVVAIAVGAVLVLVHAAVRRTDDLVVAGGGGDDDEEDVRGGLGERMPLKDTASSSFSAS